jgi:hypothetical protein
LDNSAKTSVNQQEPFEGTKILNLTQFRENQSRTSLWFSEHFYLCFLEIPPSLVHRGNLEELLLFTQPHLRNGEFNADNAILCPTNEHAEMINNLALDLLGGSSITYAPLIQ